MRTSPRIISIFLNLALLGSIGSEVVAFGQEAIELTVPENDPIKNSLEVQSVAFSPDGNLIATGHGFPAIMAKPEPGGTVLWERRTGKRLKTILALEDGIHSVAFSPNGKTLAVLEGGGIIRLFAVPEGRELRKFQAKREEDTDPMFYSFAFFPNGERLAAGLAAPVGEPCDIAILDVASGKQILTLAGHSGIVTSVAVSPDGKLLASGGFDGTARTWDALTGKPLGTFKFPSLRKKLPPGADEDLIWVNSVAFSPDGRTLAAAGVFNREAAVEIWDISTGKTKATLNDIDPEIRQVVFSADGKKLVTAGKEVKLWDAPTFKASGAIEGGAWPIALPPDGKMVALATSARTVSIVDPQKQGVLGPQVVAVGQEAIETIELTLPGNDPIKNSDEVRSIAFSPDGNLIATGHGFPAVAGNPVPGGTVLWERRTGKRLKTILALKDGIESVAFSPNGKALAVLEGGGIIRLIAIPEGREVHILQAKDTAPPFYSFAFFPNGERLAVGHAGRLRALNDVAILDVASEKQILTLVGHVGWVRSVAVSPDGKLLASGGFDGTARIWDALTGKPLGTVRFPSLRKKLPPEAGEISIWVNSVAFSPDGRTLAASGILDTGGAVEIWDISTGKTKTTLNDIDSEVREVVFSPDGKKLMTVGKEIKLWDIATSKASGAMEGGDWPIALSRDWKMVALPTSARTVSIVDAQKLRLFNP